MPVLTRLSNSFHCPRSSTDVSGSDILYVDKTGNVNILYKIVIYLKNAVIVLKFASLLMRIK